MTKSDIKSVDLSHHHILVQSIMQGKLFAGQAHQSFELIETHISSVIIGDDYVYKLKKPLDLGFLNFSTLQKRHFYCNEEVRLNRRLSPQLYVDVMAVYGSVEQPSLQVDGPVLEYLIRMKPFPQQVQLDRLLLSGEVTEEVISQFATYIARFHHDAQPSAGQSAFGNPEQVMQPVAENFRQIRSIIDDQAIISQLNKLQHWSEQEFNRMNPLLKKRKAECFIRECHGDLHLRNLAWMDRQPLAFDCIEFDPGLYWIDVINDLAFLWMDLLYHQRADLAWILLNQYLQTSGDYQAMTVLRFYSVYRAMVRAKIAAITYSQSDLSLRNQALQDLNQHLQLAIDLTQQLSPAIYLMHGPSASGKSTISKQLVAPLQAVILRSDIERKRIFGLDAEQRGHAEINEGIYSEQATQQTYLRLKELAEGILKSGYSVIVDATFNLPDQRDLFLQLSQLKKAQYFILDLKVPESVLKQRILQRLNDVSDADIDVLENQLKQWQPLKAAEQRFAITLEVDDSVDQQELLKRIQAEFCRLR